MKTLHLFVTYIVIAILLFIGGNEARQKKANFFGKTLFLPFLRTVNYFENLEILSQQNIKLQKELVKKKITNKILRSELSKQRLSAIEKIPDSLKIELFEIVGYRGQLNQRNLILNGGKNNNLNIDYPVLTKDGIVGKIILVSDNYSVVLPYTNAQFKLSVMTQRNKVQGILQSDMYGNVSMNFIPLNANISLGDTVVTSNFSNIFPKNFQVGRITKIHDSKDALHIKADISGFNNVNNLDQVIVLYYKEQKNYEEEFDKKS